MASFIFSYVSRNCEFINVDLSDFINVYNICCCRFEYYEGKGQSLFLLYIHSFSFCDAYNCPKCSFKYEHEILKMPTCLYICYKNCVWPLSGFKLTELLLLIDTKK